MANRGVNKVILLGRLGADPDIRFMPNNGGKVVAVRLATSEVWNDPKNGKQERTEWHRVVFFKKLADTAEQYLHKGSQIYIEGRLRTQQWGQANDKRYRTEIAAFDRGVAIFAERFFRASQQEKIGKNYATAYAFGAPIRPRHLVPTQQGVETSALA